MDSIKNIVTGAIVTLFIGGTAYTVNQSDIIKNFSDDTGFTQEQAEQYIAEIPEEDLVSWEAIGSDFISISQDFSESIHEVDCVNYEYEWESSTLSCSDGKKQLEQFAWKANSLGKAYIKLSSDSASTEDIQETIRLTDQLNYDLEESLIIYFLLDQETIDEFMTTNLYNKALLKSALESISED